MDISSCFATTALDFCFCQYNISRQTLNTLACHFYFQYSVETCTKGLNETL